MVDRCGSVVFKSWIFLTLADSAIPSKPLGNDLNGLCHVIICNSAARLEFLRDYIVSDGT